MEKTRNGEPGQSVTSAASAFLARMRRLREEQPEGTDLVVTIRTPNDEIMYVEGLHDEGFGLFCAKGKVNDAHCVLVAHVFTLQFFCSYKPVKDGDRVHGFMAVLSDRNRTTEPQIEPESQSQDKKE
jgi:hypothetical protein